MQLRAPDGEVIARVEDKKLAASVFLLLLLVIGHSSIFENINGSENMSALDRCLFFAPPFYVLFLYIFDIYIFSIKLDATIFPFFGRVMYLCALCFVCLCLHCVYLASTVCIVHKPTRICQKHVFAYICSRGDISCMTSRILPTFMLQPRFTIGLACMQIYFAYKKLCVSSLDWDLPILSISFRYWHKFHAKTIYY